MTRAFLAIVGDTWRQSKQQLVFLVFIGILALFALAVPSLCRVGPTKAGDYVLTFVFVSETPAGLEVVWDGLYRDAVAGEKMTQQLRAPEAELARVQDEARAAQDAVLRARLTAAPADQQKELEQKFDVAKKVYDEKLKAFEVERDKLHDEAQALVDQRTPGMTPLHKGVEVWLSGAVQALFVLSLIVFIAACAGYYPGMLASGAVDVLVSKPLARAHIFFAKYVGGLVFFSLALFAAYLVMFVGMGFRTGIWHPRLFAALPITIFSAALLYAFVACVGVFTRSTPLAIIVGYIYYLVLDFFIWAIQGISRIQSDIAWLDRVSEISRWVFPGFSRLREAAGAAVLNVPVFDWQPVLVGVAWMALLLGASFAWFRRLDF